MRLSFARSAAVSLALSAMVLRALLPDGWMPGGGSATPFIICSVDGVHHDGKSQPAPERSHAPCAFAAAAPLAPPAAVAFTAALPSQAGRAVAPDVDRRLSLSAPYRPNAARAPPVFS